LKLFLSGQLQLQTNLKSIQTITQFINKRINGTTINRSVNGQLSFVLAYNQKPKFEDFFQKLEEIKTCWELKLMVSLIQH
jgi:hypothetical protein